jgi:hypothetical protein
MDIVSLTRNLAHLAAAPPVDVSNEQRKAFLLACEEARLAMENPLEATVRFMFGVSHQSGSPTPHFTEMLSRLQAFESVALCLAIDMNLIDQAIAAHGEITAEQLASDKDADTVLVSEWHVAFLS